jgi:outer membrane lipoprotein-sorting protein
MAGTAAVRADPNPVLPAVTPQQLLTSTLQALAQPVTISGRVTTRLDLGIPDLPSGMGSAQLGSLSMLMGDQHFKVWHSPDGVRVAQLTDFGERDAVANHTDAWLWDSSQMSAQHLSLSSLPTPATPDPSTAPSMGDITAFAQKVLADVQGYANVSIDTTARVAGRPVYQLVLTPFSTLTRIGMIEMAIDAQTRLPLRVQVFPRGSTRPALEGGFTSVSFGPIASSVFDFTPPPGTTVTQVDTSKFKTAQQPGATDPTGAAANDGVRSFGKGFDLRWALRLSGPVPANAAALLPYAGPLASAITVQRGATTWLLVGFVDLDTLGADALQLP